MRGRLPLLVRAVREVRGQGISGSGYVDTVASQATHGESGGADLWMLGSGR